MCKTPKLRRQGSKRQFPNMSQPQQVVHSPTKKKRNGSIKTDAGAVEAPGDSGTKDRKVGDKKKPLHLSMEQLQMEGKGKSSNANRREAGSNWRSALGAPSSENSRRNSLKVDHPDTAAVSSADENENATGNSENAVPSTGLSKSARLRQRRKAAQRNKYVAMDCEMVGVGFNGQTDMLARVSIVNRQGEVLLDKFVKPLEAVTDYRTSVSGIRPRDIENGEDFNVVQDEVLELLQGKILVGHGIRSDLAVLHLKHPYSNIRDTSRYKPLCKLVANGRTPSLKRLSQAILGLEIQTGEHNSVEDARAAMSIYNRLSADWEKYIQKHHSHIRK